MAKSPAITVDISFNLFQRSDGWWDLSYEAFVGPGIDIEGQQQRLASGSTQGGSRRVVVNSVMRHIREEAKQYADEHFG